MRGNLFSTFMVGLSNAHTVGLMNQTVFVQLRHGGSAIQKALHERGALATVTLQEQSQKLL